MGAMVGIFTHWVFHIVGKHNSALTMWECCAPAWPLPTVS